MGLTAFKVSLRLIALQAKIFLSYRSSVSPDVARTYLDTQSLSMGLPLTVNVQDFFRPQW